MKSFDFNSVSLISKREDIFSFTTKVIGDVLNLVFVPEITEITFDISSYVFIDLSSCTKENILKFFNFLKINKEKIIYYISFSVDEKLLEILKDEIINIIVYPSSEKIAESYFYEVVERSINEGKKENIDYSLNVEEEEKFKDFIGDSEVSKALKRKIIVCSRMEVPVLLLGETGTGKSTAAKIIHELSRRKNKPFVSINISNYEDTLADSELFGAEKGAYTDAIKRDGKFKKAEGGTLFIDEIANASLGVQGKLLKVLDDGSYFSVGSDNINKSNVKLIFATNANLKKMILEKKFRNDLFYRINGYTIKFPQLKDRIEDIGSLSFHFAQKNNKTITERAIRMLEEYSWPGNIRQLRYCIDSACKLEKSEIDIQDINFDV